MLWPTVFDQLKQMLAGYGGSILFADLAPFYAGLYPETDLRRVFYTGLSDGQNIILHDRQEQTRSPVQWAWDSLHLFGHMLQWHMEEAQASSIGISYFGAEARAMATRNFLGSSFAELAGMQNYELEANRLSLSLFEESVRRSQHLSADIELPELISDLRLYTAKDIAFLTSYYAGPREYDSRLLSQEQILAQLLPISAPSLLKFKKIDQICVPVVHSEHNSSRS